MHTRLGLPLPRCTQTHHTKQHICTVRVVLLRGAPFFFLQRHCGRSGNIGLKIPGKHPRHSLRRPGDPLENSLSGSQSGGFRAGRTIQQNGETAG